MMTDEEANEFRHKIREFFEEAHPEDTLGLLLTTIDSLITHYFETPVLVWQDIERKVRERIAQLEDDDAARVRH